VEELHGLSYWELKKHCEGASVLLRYSHEALDFVAELEGFEFFGIFLQFLVGVGNFL
jgi:hypothetical protein